VQQVAALGACVKSGMLVVLGKGLLKPAYSCWHFVVANTSLPSFTLTTLLLPLPFFFSPTLVKQIPRGNCQKHSAQVGG
jgi:hypothetical protein